MIVYQHDINSLARSQQNDNIAPVTAVSIPSVPRWAASQLRFPHATHEIGTYETGSGLACGGDSYTTACVVALVAASLGVALIGWRMWGRG